MWTTTSEEGSAVAAGGHPGGAWCRYLRAVAPYRALERARDALLAPVDVGERALRPDEQAALDGLTAAMARCERAVQAAEPGLLRAARACLGRRPDLVDAEPALGLLLEPIPPGQWVVAVALAEWLLGQLGAEELQTADMTA